MFKLAIRMFRSDMRTMLQNLVIVILFIIFILLILIVPLTIDGSNFFTFFYLGWLTVTMFGSRFTRVFHVAPFTIGQIKRLILYRVLIVAMLFGTVGLFFVGIGAVRRLDLNPRFGLWYIAYMNMVISTGIDGGLKGFGVGELRTTTWKIIAFIVLVWSGFVAVGLGDKLSLLTEYLIQAGTVVVFFVAYVLVMFRGMDFGDFSQVKDRFTDREEFLV